VQHYVRLSRPRTTDVYCATTMVLTYLLRAKSGHVECEHSFLGINLFYLLGTMAEWLSLQSVESMGVYSMMEELQPVSFHLSLFEFFAHLSLGSPKDQTLCKFAIDCLDFLTLPELKNLKIFIQVYSQIETLFALLIKQAMQLALPDSAKVQTHWAQLHRCYLEQRDASSADGLRAQPEEHIKSKMAETMLLTDAQVASKLDLLRQERRCDFNKLQEMCS
jgi:hypothetical protein